MRQAVLNSVYKLAKINNKIIYIGSDLGPNVLKDFKKKFPSRFFMEGAAEQHIISMACGMAQEGFIPYVNTIATFLTRRCFEQISLDMGLQKTKIRLIANGGGLVYAPLGPTHLAIDDISIMRTVPNMTILVPADSLEMSKLMNETINYSGPIYIRVAKGGDPIVTNGLYSKFKIGKLYKIGKEKEIIIITTGISLNTALKIRESLNKEGHKIGVVHTPTVKPINQKQLYNFTKNSSIIVTIEEQSIVGGLGGAISEILIEKNLKKLKKFKRIGLPDIFPKGYGRQHNMMQRYNIDYEGCLKTIKNLIL